MSRIVTPSRRAVSADAKRKAFVKGLNAGRVEEPYQPEAATGPTRSQAEKDKLRAAMRRGIRGEGRA